MSETPEQIWIQPQYVNALIEGGGIYHLKGPSSAIIQVVRYVREDLATCTPEERAVIEAAVGFRNALQPWSSRIPIAAQKVLVSNVDALLAAKAKIQRTK